MILTLTESVARQLEIKRTELRRLVNLQARTTIGTTSYKSAKAKTFSQEIVVDQVSRSYNKLKAGFKFTKDGWVTA